MPFLCLKSRINDYRQIDWNSFLVQARLSYTKSKNFYVRKTLTKVFRTLLMVEVRYERKKRDIPRENQRNYKEKGLGAGGGA